MSYQAYLDNIKKKTGKSPDDFRALAEKLGLLRADRKAGEVLAWLRKEFGLGHGHAMAIYGTLKSGDGPRHTVAERVAEHFSGRRAIWQRPYRQLMINIEKFGPDVSVKPTGSYISILRNAKKFAIVQIHPDYIDVGIKAKVLRTNARLTAAGKWNTMVTHRVRIDDPKQIDHKLIGWLQAAYEGALPSQSASSRRARLTSANNARMQTSPTTGHRSR